jgi:hypothetical protein
MLLARADEVIESRRSLLQCHEFGRPHLWQRVWLNIG